MDSSPAFPLLKKYASFLLERLPEITSEDQPMAAVLQSIVTDNAEAEQSESLKTDRATESLPEVLRTYRTCKRMLVQGLPRYTADVAEATAIVAELDEWFGQNEQDALRTFLAVHASEQTRNQNLLQASQALAHVGSWEWNVMTNEITWSDELLRIFGYEPDTHAFDYRTYLQQLHPDDRDAVNAVVQQSLATHQPYTVEHRIVRPDGTVGWITGKGKVVLSGQGTVERMIGVAIDHTDQKHAQAELREKNEELRTTNSALVQAEEQLRQLNVTLEARVAQRTTELQAVQAERTRLHQQQRQTLQQTVQQITELNEKLMESENFLSSILDQSPVSTWIADADGTQIRVNKACLQLFGVADATLGLGKYNILKDETLVNHPFYPDIVAVFREGKLATFSGDYDLSAVRHVAIPTARPLTLVATIFPIKNKLGRVTHAVIQHEDITHRKRAEEALKASEERYRSFVQQSSEAIWRFELDGIPGISPNLPEDEQIEQMYRHIYLAECNDAVARMYGYASADEIVGARLGDLIIRTDENNIAYLKSFIRSGYRLTDALSVETDKAGNTKYFLNNLTGIYQGDVLVRAWGTQRDVTDQKKAEDALRASEDQLRHITDALPVLISYVDHTERYRFNNRLYEEWFGVRRADVYGKTLPEVIGPAAYEKTKAYVHRALRGETVHYEGEVPYQGAGNRFVSINLIPHTTNRQTVGYYVLITDVSEQKRTQQALETALQESRQRNDELRRANNDLDNFVYTASHDLRAPLANLEGLHRLLEKRVQGKLDATEQELMQFIAQSIGKLTQTIQDLTEIVKVQKDTEQVREPVQFADVLADVRADVAPLAAESNAQVVTDFSVTGIEYPRKHLRSILYNLLSNAFKYRSPDRPLNVYIRTWQQNENPVLSVADNGLGMEINSQNRLFQMFQRFHPHVAGSGIGLYMVKRIVENNGGQITVDSQKGVGTTFTVFF